MQENLLGLVEQAGVVGAGGAGFPTHVKLKAQADTVIINGAECEPLLRVDQQLMALQAGDLLDALDLLVEQVGASQGVVALKEHYAAKAANVRLMEIRIARGLGGKGFVILTGEVSAVRSAVKAAMNQLEETGDITSSSVIASPHPGLIDKLTN